jgi:hypothetical protein
LNAAGNPARFGGKPSRITAQDVAELRKQMAQ